MAENDLTKNFTISVRNVPNAKIFIECKERSFIEVEQGTICHWKVSAPGYKDQIGEIKIVSDINLTLTLQKVPPKPTPSNSYMKVRPKKGAYVVDYKELFKDTIPPTEEHDNEYLWCSHGYLWWKKLTIPTPETLFVNELGTSVTTTLTQDAITKYLNEKANVVDVYDKAFIDEALSKKLDTADSLKGAVLDKTICVFKDNGSFSAGEKLLFNGYMFEYGVTAFGTISEALKIDTAETIYIGTGTFEEDLLIKNNNLNIIGTGDVVIRGKITLNATNGFSMKGVNVVYDATEENTAAIEIKKSLNNFSLKNVDVIVHGPAHAINSRKNLIDSSIVDCHFISGLDESNNLIDGIIINNAKKFRFSRNCIFGNIKFKTAINDVEISANNFTSSEGTLISFEDGMLSNKINIFGNLAFGDSIDNIVTTKNIDFSNIEQFNIVGNHVCYNHAFFWLQEGCVGIDNDKIQLSFNTANNAKDSKFILDDEPIDGEARVLIDDGNIITDDQAITVEQLNSAVKTERERAIAAENVINDLIKDHIENKNNPHNVTKEQIGLGNVDNTSDLMKPISNATQEALDKKLDSASLPTKLPNPTKLEILMNGMFVTEYYGGEDAEQVTADLHFDRTTSAQLSWVDVRGIMSADQMVNITSENLFEKGEIVNYNLTWDPVDVNLMEIKRQWINDTEVSDSARSYIFENVQDNINATVSILYGNKEGSTENYTAKVSSTISIKFLNKIYWGASEAEELDNDAIIQLNNKLSDKLENTFSFNCEGGKYMFFAVPKELINNDVIITCGGLIYSDWTQSEISLKNEHNYTTYYVVFRSNNIQSTKHIEISLK